MIEIQVGKTIIPDEMDTFDLWLSMNEISTFEATFRGYVEDINEDVVEIKHNNALIYNGNGRISNGLLSAENAISTLANTKISSVLLNCDPQEVIKSICSKLELIIELDQTKYPKKKSFVIGGLSILEVFEKIAVDWNRPFKFYLVENKLFWGEINLLSDNQVQYQSGINIIEVSYDDDLKTGTLTGFLDLSLKPGLTLKIIDEDIPNLVYTIDKLHHYRQNSKSRTVIYFRRISE